jgi:hypothetical protein
MFKTLSGLAIRALLGLGLLYGGYGGALEGSGSGQAGPPGAKPLEVLYEDGVRVPVNEWVFDHGFAEFEGEIPFMISSSSLRHVSTKDLLLETGKKVERGMTFPIERKFQRSELASIRFEWNSDKSAVERTVISLTNGESVALSNYLRIAQGMVSKAKRISFTEIYLRGTGNLKGRTAPFSARIDAIKDSEHKLGPKDRIVEIRFSR